MGAASWLVIQYQFIQQDLDIAKMSLEFDPANQTRQLCIIARSLSKISEYLDSRNRGMQKWLRIIAGSWRKCNEKQPEMPHSNMIYYVACYTNTDDWRDILSCSFN